MKFAFYMLVGRLVCVLKVHAKPRKGKNYITKKIIQYEKIKNMLKQTKKFNKKYIYIVEISIADGFVQ